MLDSLNALQIKLARKYLKLKLIEDNVTFRGHNLERKHLYDLVKKTIVNGQSNSAFIIGPRGSGKTTLINSVINQISKEVDLTNDAIIVRLNGMLHHDDKVALNSITKQMQLENVVGDRVFGSFAENLTFLLSCLQTGSDRSCKSMLFVLDEFDMFCHVGQTQTLLYNFFDITHRNVTPICVIGLTRRIDVKELLEKRVKSRFSYRHIYLFPTEDTEFEINPQRVRKTPLETYLNVFVELLSLPKKKISKLERKKSKKNSRKRDLYKDLEAEGEMNFSIPEEVLVKCHTNSAQFDGFDEDFIENWNEQIQKLSENDKLVDEIERFCYYTYNQQVFKDMLFQVISKLSPTKTSIDVEDIITAIDKTVAPEHRVALLKSLSILELSLVIAMKHGMDIFDGQPMNFEMILHRYLEFANTKSSSQKVPRSAIMKAFDHLESLEIVTPIRNYAQGQNSTARWVQREYQLFTLAVPFQDINEAIKGFKALPTEIAHWYNNSVV